MGNIITTVINTAGKEITRAVKDKATNELKKQASILGRCNVSLVADKAVNKAIDKTVEGARELPQKLRDTANELYKEASGQLYHQQPLQAYDPYYGDYFTMYHQQQQQRFSPIPQPNLARQFYEKEMMLRRR